MIRRNKFATKIHCSTSSNYISIEFFMIHIDWYHEAIWIRCICETILQNESEFQLCVQIESRQNKKCAKSKAKESKTEMLMNENEIIVIIIIIKRIVSVCRYVQGMQNYAQSITAARRLLSFVSKIHRVSCGSFVFFSIRVLSQIL